MDNDDEQVGRILTRREVLALLGVTGAGIVASRLPAQAQVASAMTPSGMHFPACIVTPSQTEGPYFTDRKLNRVDIRSDPSNGKLSEGTPLDLELKVFRVNNGTCEPLAGAMVDVWQCDAVGTYSDVRDTNGFFTTTGQQFLRGYQETDATGVARFTTIYPGWYQGRCVHVHFKVRSSGNREFTSQLYFDDAITDKVHTVAPYTGKQGQRVRNERDGIFRRGGNQLMLNVSEAAGAYRGTFEIGLVQG